MKFSPPASKRHAWAGLPRGAGVVLCLIVAGCSGGKLPGGQAALRGAGPAALDASSPAVAAQQASSPQASPPQTPSAQAAQAQPAPSQVASSQPPSPPLSESDRVLQVRADCWMKVERERGLRDIDRRIAFVEKCVDGEMKGRP